MIFKPCIRIANIAKQEHQNRTILSIINDKLIKMKTITFLYKNGLFLNNLT